MRVPETVYDISVLLGEESIDYPGDTLYSLEKIEKLENNGSYDLSALRMSAHTGTHIDSPAHFLPDGKTIDQYPLQRFILPAQVVPVEDRKSVRPNELENLLVQEGEALLFKTKNSISGRSRSGVFSEHFVYFSTEAADYCVRKGVGLVGLDYISIEKYGDPDFPAHRTLMKNEILVLEGIHLKHVPPGRYTLVCLPLRIKGCEASPVRAILIP